MNCTQEMNSLTQQAERVVNDQRQRFSDAASPGDRVRQGDVFITRIKAIPDGTKKMDRFLLQLAPGNTQGSRHTLDSADGVTMYQLAEPGPYDGPIIQTTQERTVTHPEHGDWVLPPGCYAVTYQRTQDAEDRERRVQD